MLCTVHCCFGVMLFGLKKVAVSDVRVMVALPVMAFLMRLGSFVMMFRCMFVMFGGFRVVIGEFLSGHCFLFGVSSAPHCTIGPSCDVRMNSLSPHVRLVSRSAARSQNEVALKASPCATALVSPLNREILPAN